MLLQILIRRLLELPTLSLIVVNIGLFLLVWRVWTFTLRPLIWRSEPQYMPYWIPCQLHPYLGVK